VALAARADRGRVGTSAKRACEKPPLELGDSLVGVAQQVKPSFDPPTGLFGVQKGKRAQREDGYFMFRLFEDLLV
jgi:hypothetical protein